MAHVQSTFAAYSGGATQNLPFTRGVTAGSLLVAVATTSTTGAAYSVSDGVNTWTRVITGVGDTSGLTVWYAYNAAAGATTVTFTLDIGVSGDIAVLEYDHVYADTDPVDQINSTTYTATTTPSISDTTTSPRELVLGFLSNVTATVVLTPPSGMITRSQSSFANGHTVFERITPFVDTFNVNPTMNASSTGGIGIVTFRMLSKKLYVNARRPAVFSPGLAR